MADNGNILRALILIFLFIAVIRLYMEVANYIGQQFRKFIKFIYKIIAPKKNK